MCPPLRACTAAANSAFEIANLQHKKENMPALARWPARLTSPKRTSRPVRRTAATRQIQTFRLHRASNWLDGSRSESGKPARHIGAIAFILGSEALAERRLLIGNYENMKKEPDQRAVAEEMPVSE